MGLPAPISGDPDNNEGETSVYSALHATVSSQRRSWKENCGADNSIAAPSGTYRSRSDDEAQCEDLKSSTLNSVCAKKSALGGPCPNNSQVFQDTSPAGGLKLEDASTKSLLGGSGMDHAYQISGCGICKERSHLSMPLSGRNLQTMADGKLSFSLETDGPLLTEREFQAFQIRRHSYQFNANQDSCPKTQGQGIDEVSYQEFPSNSSGYSRSPLGPKRHSGYSILDGIMALDLQ